MSGTFAAAVLLYRFVPVLSEWRLKTLIRYSTLLPGLMHQFAVLVLGILMTMVTGHRTEEV
jgi:hypothetical protein